MRTLLLASLLAAIGCTFTPDVAPYRPKSAAQCPGQKACGYRCVDVDDPAAGCGPSSCEPCTASFAQTVPVCGEGLACAWVCAAGWANCDGDASNGCETPVAADPGNCGACGHACAPGDTCAGGQCQAAPATVIADTDEQPRGLAVGGGVIAWATDPPVAGGVAPVGALHRWSMAGGNVIDVTPGFGHPTFVRSAGGTGVAIAGTDSVDGGPMAWLVDPTSSPATIALGGGQGSGSVIAGLVLTADWFVSAVSPEGFVESDSYDGGVFGFVSLPLTDDVFALGEGAGLLWVGVTGGVYRLSDSGGGLGYDIVTGGGVYFDKLVTPPRPGRVAAHAGAMPSDPVVVYFADLEDGSIWKGRTTGRPTADQLNATPWRIVKGDGPRTAMDLAADDSGAVWSDYDKGEIWAVTPDGQIHRLAAGVRPWAIALTPTTVFFTDVDARAIESVAR